MPEYSLTINFSNSGTRNEVRMRVVQLLSCEHAGAGTGRLASRYTYYVEKLSDGNHIYLRRPANLHNGFDFLVCVENYNFNTQNARKRNYPKHDDLKKDLDIKKNAEPQKYKQLFDLIERVYNCQDVNDIELKAVDFKSGYFQTDLIVKTYKWLFIEQDIRYWNYSGREMLWNGIPRP